MKKIHIGLGALAVTVGIGTLMFLGTTHTALGDALQEVLPIAGHSDMQVSQPDNGSRPEATPVAAPQPGPTATPPETQKASTQAPDAPQSLLSTDPGIVADPTPEATPEATPQPTLYLCGGIYMAVPCPVNPGLHPSQDPTGSTPVGQAH